MNGTKRIIAMMSLSIVVTMCASGAFAWGARNNSNNTNGSTNRGSHAYRENRGYVNGSYGYRGNNGFYRGSYDYNGCEFWPYGAINFNIMDPPIGAMFGYIPNGSTLVVVDGIGYYYFNGYYLRPCPSGYMVVTPPEVAPPPALEPKVASQPAPSSDNSVTINIPNSKGGFTSVKLTKSQDGYKGPQGEFYPDHPTVDELRVLYGD